MPAKVSQENWKKLVGILGVAVQHLDKQNHPALVETLSRFVQATETIGLQDMAAIAHKLLRFAVMVIPPSWDEEAGGTFGFTLGGVFEKMEKETYGPNFASELEEVLIFLEMFYEDKGLSSDEEDSANQTGETPPTAESADHHAEVGARPVPPRDETPPPSTGEEAPLGLDLDAEIRQTAPGGTALPPGATSTPFSPPSTSETGTMDILSQDLMDELFAQELSDTSEESTQQPAERADGGTGILSQELMDELFAAELSDMDAESGQVSASPVSTIEPVTPALDSLDIPFEPPTRPEVKAAQPDLVVSEEPPSPSPVILASDPPTDPLELFRLLLHYDPRSVVFVRLAEALCSMRLWSEAIAVLTRGLAIHPHELRAKVLLGWATFELGDAVEAQRTLASVEADFRANAVAFDLLGDLADSRGEADSASRYREIHRLLTAQSETTVRATAREAQTFAYTPIAKDAPAAAVPSSRPVGEPLPVVSDPPLLSLLQGLVERMTPRPARAPRPLFSSTDRDSLADLLGRAPS